ncbi:pectate lyase superfamily protein-domain-containing protein [Mycena rebaudengoi]|nr:pectate lyase superfamily protein-domain-containing protein [Mycena rebaudengoi]
MRNLSFSLAALAIFFRSASSTCSEPLTGTASSSDPFWMRNGGLQIQGKSAYNPGFKVFRDVKLHYGAVGDGIADDTAAINKAITDGGRCGLGCHSSTITPAIVYFPSGKYRVTKPIVPFYFTSLVGDANNKPILIADPNFVGTAVIDANPYKEGESNPDGSGVNWWINQNNFFRSIRNFVIDVTAMSPEKSATGIHWQVGQATSLINIDFKMVRATVTPTTNHQGLFAENGSGGFMSDLTFDGAKILRRVRCDGRKLVRGVDAAMTRRDAAVCGGTRRDAAKYMVNFAVAMVLDAAIRGGMRRVNVRDAVCSNYDAALTTLDAALTTLDAALKILDAAALRLHPTEPAMCFL